MIHRKEDKYWFMGFRKYYGRFEIQKSIFVNASSIDEEIYTIVKSEQPAWSHIVVNQVISRTPLGIGPSRSLHSRSLWFASPWLISVRNHSNPCTKMQKQRKHLWQSTCVEDQCMREALPSRVRSLCGRRRDENTHSRCQSAARQANYVAPMRRVTT